MCVYTEKKCILNGSIQLLHAIQICLDKKKKNQIRFLVGFGWYNSSHLNLCSIDYNITS